MSFINKLTKGSFNSKITPKRFDLKTSKIKSLFNKDIHQLDLLDELKPYQKNNIFIVDKPLDTRKIYEESKKHYEILDLILDDFNFSAAKEFKNILTALRGGATMQQALNKDHEYFQFFDSAMKNYQPYAQQMLTDISNYFCMKNKAKETPETYCVIKSSSSENLLNTLNCFTNDQKIDYSKTQFIIFLNDENEKSKLLNFKRNIKNFIDFEKQNPKMNLNLIVAAYPKKQGRYGLYQFLPAHVSSYMDNEYKKHFRATKQKAKLMLFDADLKSLSSNALSNLSQSLDDGAITVNGISNECTPSMRKNVNLFLAANIDLIAQHTLKTFNEFPDLVHKFSNQDYSEHKYVLGDNDSSYSIMWSKAYLPLLTSGLKAGCAAMPMPIYSLVNGFFPHLKAGVDSEFANRLTRLSDKKYGDLLFMHTINKKVQANFIGRAALRAFMNGKAQLMKYLRYRFLKKANFKKLKEDKFINKKLLLKELNAHLFFPFRSLQKLEKRYEYFNWADSYFTKVKDERSPCKDKLNLTFDLIQLLCKQLQEFQMALKRELGIEVEYDLTNKKVKLI